MLKHLEISNFAVIDKVTLDIGEGLNILTGETGSGKSIIISAMGLLTGSRSSVEQVRTGERVAVIEGIFRVESSSKSSVDKILGEVGITLSVPTEITIRREVSAVGKNRIFIGDEMVNAATLQLLQPYLIDIFGQGDQRTLLSKRFQLSLLDDFARCSELSERVMDGFRRWKTTAAALLAHRAELSEAKRLEDYLQYQLAEIKTAATHAGEDIELQAEKKLLAHAEKISQLSSSAYDELYENDESIIAKLAYVRRRLEDLSEFDPDATGALDQLQATVLTLTDIVEGLRRRNENIVYSPQRLADIEHRLSELEKLKRKYNTDLQGILQLQDELSGKLSMIADDTDNEQQLVARMEEAKRDYMGTAQLLSDKRRSAAPLLARRVTAALSNVALEQASFLVAIETLRSGQEELCTAEGIDSVEFLLAANPGEPPRPLAKVASGGELSRLMLVLRTTGTRAHKSAEHSETLVFDEIDAGIGGRAAEAVGHKLKTLATGTQVVCVTHQPQIARFADQHYVISKTVKNGRTHTCINKMEGDARVRELARMIGGHNVEAATIEAARCLLENFAGTAKLAPLPVAVRHTRARK